MLRHYLELIVDLPWNKSTKDNIDISKAREVMSEPSILLYILAIIVGPRVTTTQIGVQLPIRPVASGGGGLSTFSRRNGGCAPIYALLPIIFVKITSTTPYLF